MPEVIHITLQDSGGGQTDKRPPTDAKTMDEFIFDELSVGREIRSIFESIEEMRSGRLSYGGREIATITGQNSETGYQKACLLYLKALGGKDSFEISLYREDQPEKQEREAARIMGIQGAVDEALRLGPEVEVPPRLTFNDETTGQTSEDATTFLTDLRQNNWGLDSQQPLAPALADKLKQLETLAADQTRGAENRTARIIQAEYRIVLSLRQAEQTLQSPTAYYLWRAKGIENTSLRPERIQAKRNKIHDTHGGLDITDEEATIAIRRELLDTLDNELRGHLTTQEQRVILDGREGGVANNLSAWARATLIDNYSFQLRLGHLRRFGTRLDTGEREPIGQLARYFDVSSTGPLPGSIDDFQVFTGEIQVDEKGVHYPKYVSIKHVRQPGILTTDSFKNEREFINGLTIVSSFCDTADYGELVSEARDRGSGLDIKKKRDQHVTQALRCAVDSLFDFFTEDMTRWTETLSAEWALVHEKILPILGISEKTRFETLKKVITFFYGKFKDLAAFGPDKASEGSSQSGSGVPVVKDILRLCSEQAVAIAYQIAEAQAQHAALLRLNGLLAKKEEKRAQAQREGRPLILTLQEHNQILDAERIARFVPHDATPETLQTRIDELTAELTKLMESKVGGGDDLLVREKVGQATRMASKLRAMTGDMVLMRKEEAGKTGAWFFYLTYIWRALHAPNFLREVVKVRSVYAQKWYDSPFCDFHFSTLWRVSVIKNMWKQPDKLRYLIQHGHSHLLEGYSDEQGRQIGPKIRFFRIDQRSGQKVEIGLDPKTGKPLSGRAVAELLKDDRVWGSIDHSLTIIEPDFVDQLDFSQIRLSEVFAREAAGEFESAFRDETMDDAYHKWFNNLEIIVKTLTSIKNFFDESEKNNVAGMAQHLEQLRSSGWTYENKEFQAPYLRFFNTMMESLYEMYHRAAFWRAEGLEMWNAGNRDGAEAILSDLQKGAYSGSYGILFLDTVIDRGARELPNGGGPVLNLEELRNPGSAYSPQEAARAVVLLLGGVAAPAGEPQLGVSARNMVELLVNKTRRGFQRESIARCESERNKQAERSDSLEIRYEDVLAFAGLIVDEKGIVRMPRKDEEADKLDRRRCSRVRVVGDKGLVGEAPLEEWMYNLLTDVMKEAFAHAIQTREETTGDGKKITVVDRSARCTRLATPLAMHELIISPVLDYFSDLRRARGLIEIHSALNKRIRMGQLLRLGYQPELNMGYATVVKDPTSYIYQGLLRDVDPVHSLEYSHTYESFEESGRRVFIPPLCLGNDPVRLILETVLYNSGYWRTTIMKQSESDMFFQALIPRSIWTIILKELVDKIKVLDKDEAAEVKAQFGFGRMATWEAWAQRLLIGTRIGGEGTGLSKENLEKLKGGSKLGRSFAPVIGKIYPTSAADLAQRVGWGYLYVTRVAPFIVNKALPFVLTEWAGMTTVPKWTETALFLTLANVAILFWGWWAGGDHYGKNSYLNTEEPRELSFGAVNILGILKKHVFQRIAMGKNMWFNWECNVNRQQVLTLLDENLRWFKDNTGLFGRGKHD